MIGPMSESAPAQTAREEPTAVPSRPNARVVLRPVATPLTLGFLTLAAASFVVSGLELSWVNPATNWAAVGLVILTFVVPLQLISAVFGFLARDPVASAGMGILAGTWLAVGAVTYTGAPTMTSGAVGLLLLASASALLVPAAAGLSSKIAASAVLITAALRFYLTGVYELTDGAAWRLAAGVAGLVLTAVAGYTALAFELEGAHLRTVLPVGRRGRGRDALAGDFASQVRDVHHEAGVRQQL